MAVTREKIREYLKNNENGFKVNLQKLIYPFAHGDEYPQFQKVIFDSEEKQVILKVRYFKFYGGSAEYTIEANEFQKNHNSNMMIGGSGYFNKTIYKEEQQKGRFNFNHLKELCNTVNESTIAEVQKEYSFS